MAGVNKCLLIGRVGKDPESVSFENGGSIAKFSMATSEKYTSKSTGELVESTEWHSVVVGGKLAEVVMKYVKKGSQLYVEGKIKTRQFETKAGEKRFFTEVHIGYGGTMQMLDSKPKYEPGAGQQSQPAAKVEPQQPEPEPEDGDDLPF